MKSKKTELNVDFIGGQGALTKAEEIAIGNYIKAQKAKNSRNMPSKKKMKTVSLDKMIDKHIGKIGTPKRDAFEYKLKRDITGLAIKRRIS